MKNSSRINLFNINGAAAVLASSLLFTSLFICEGAHAASHDQPSVTDVAPAQAPFVPAPPSSSGNAGSRNFYQVLDEVLSDFEYDLKTGQVLGLKDLAVRNIVTSENIPNSFKAHLDLLLSERVVRATKTRMVHCLACRSKKAMLNGDTMSISSPEANSSELQRIAKMNNIQNFMDVAFAYQPSGMILSLEISDAETGSTLWSRSYNSENTRASAQRRGVDFQENNEDSKLKMEYQPTIQYRPSMNIVMAPKAGSGTTTALALGFRMMERYDNRKKEVGFELSSYFSVAGVSGTETAAEKKANIFSSTNITLLFTHGWGMFGDQENYNKARGVIIAGIGGTYASGFLGAVLRGGYEWRLAKHWSFDAFLGYRPQSTVVIQTGTTAALSGPEGGIGVGFIF